MGAKYDIPRHSFTRSPADRYAHPERRVEANGKRSEISYALTMNKGMRDYRGHPGKRSGPYKRFYETGCFFTTGDGRLISARFH